jgi:predicted nuclease of restriction endonuclease-like (RecB) superfamily
VNFAAIAAKLSAATLMVAKEGHDAQYKIQAGKVPLQERCAPVAELTRLPSGYPALLEELKTRIRAAQLGAALTLNQETIRLYWSIGQDLSSRFAAEGWGTKVVDRLAKDLGNEFPGVEGFSLRNLRYMRSFAEAWPDPQILQLAAKLPWGHHMVLLDRLKDGQSGIYAPPSSMAGAVTC